MKKLFIQLLAVVLSSVVFTSCSKEDNPVNPTPVTPTAQYGVSYKIDVSQDLLKYFDVRYDYVIGEEVNGMKLYGKQFYRDILIRKLPANLAFDVKITPKDGVNLDEEVNITMSAVEMFIYKAEGDKIVELKKVKSPVKQYMASGTLKDIVNEVTSWSFSAKGSIDADGKYELKRIDAIEKEDIYRVSYSINLSKDMLKYFNVRYDYQVGNDKGGMKIYGNQVFKNVLVTEVPAELTFDVKITPKEGINPDEQVTLSMDAIEMAVYKEVNDEYTEISKVKSPVKQYTATGVLKDLVEEITTWSFSAKGSIDANGKVELKRVDAVAE